MHTVQALIQLRPGAVHGAGPSPVYLKWVCKHTHTQVRRGLVGSRFFSGFIVHHARLRTLEGATVMNIGLPIPSKEHELRRALLPSELAGIERPQDLVFEQGYGNILEIADEQYARTGARIGSRAEVLACATIVDPKVGDADYLGNLARGTTIFGWVHAAENQGVADALMQGGLTAYAWEHLYEDGRHVFWRNNQLAGEAAVLHAFLCQGRMPQGQRVAVIGRGDTALGAIGVLEGLGAHVTVYQRKTEALLRKELPSFDAVVNCVMWDLTRTDHILSRDDVARMRPGSLIIDVSCDEAGAIETSHPTTIGHPTYRAEGILHYAVDHTPSLVYRTASEAISTAVAPYINELSCGKHSKTLEDGLIVRDGTPVRRRTPRSAGN